MKYDVLYDMHSTQQKIWFTEDDELNYDRSHIEANSESEALLLFKETITELMNCNCLDVEENELDITVYEPIEHDFIERYSVLEVVKMYQLVNSQGEHYYSRTPGILGGHRKLKIYGKLDCPSALRYIAKGQYVKYRVFFKDEETAIEAGYRPCAKCMKKEYEEWKNTRKF